jgi:hypothetical protein
LRRGVSFTKLKFPEAVDIICIATEAGSNKERSEDFGFFDARNWTDADTKEAQDIEMEMIEHGLFSKQIKKKGTYQEYPEVEVNEKKVLKGSYRNKPCPCGSGIKYKKCCGS